MLDLKSELDRLRKNEVSAAVSASSSVSRFSLEKIARKSRQGSLWTERFMKDNDPIAFVPSNIDDLKALERKD